MYSIIVLVLLIACVNAFIPVPSKMVAGYRLASMTKLNNASPDLDELGRDKNRCLEKDKDEKGRCPGEASYRPGFRPAPDNFAG